MAALWAGISSVRSSKAPDSPRDSGGRESSRGERADRWSGDRQSERASALTQSSEHKEDDKVEAFRLRFHGNEYKCWAHGEEERAEIVAKLRELKRELKREEEDRIRTSPTAVRVILFGGSAKRRQRARLGGRLIVAPTPPPYSPHMGSPAGVHRSASKDADAAAKAYDNVIRPKVDGVHLRKDLRPRRGAPRKNQLAWDAFEAGRTHHGVPTLLKSGLNSNALLYACCREKEMVDKAMAGWASMTEHEVKPDAEPAEKLLLANLAKGKYDDAFSTFLGVRRRRPAAGAAGVHRARRLAPSVLRPRQMRLRRAADDEVCRDAVDADLLPTLQKAW